MFTFPVRVAADGAHPVDDQMRAVLDALPTLMWLAAPDGAVAYSSRRLVEYTGLSVAQSAGWGSSPSIHQDDINRLTGCWKTVFASGASGEIESRLRRFDGQYRWFLFYAEPLRDSSGTVTGRYGTNIDDRHSAEHAARAGERALRFGPLPEVPS